MSIKIKSGNKQDLGILNHREIGLCEDTKEVMIGCNGENINIISKDNIENKFSILSLIDNSINIDLFSSNRIYLDYIKGKGYGSNSIGKYDQLSGLYTIEIKINDSEYFNFKFINPLSSLSDSIYDVLENGFITKMTNTIILDGTEDWIKKSTYDNCSRFSLSISDCKINGRINSNLFEEGIAGNDVENIDIHGSESCIMITILNSKLSSTTVAGFKEYLKSNNVFVTYELNSATKYKINKEDFSFEYSGNGNISFSCDNTDIKIKYKPYMYNEIPDDLSDCNKLSLDTNGMIDSSTIVYNYIKNNDSLYIKEDETLKINSQIIKTGKIIGEGKVVISDVYPYKNINLSKLNIFNDKLNNPILDMTIKNDYNPEVQHSIISRTPVIVNKLKPDTANYIKIWGQIFFANSNNDVSGINIEIKNLRMLAHYISTNVWKEVDYTRGGAGLYEKDFTSCIDLEQNIIDGMTYSVHFDDSTKLLHFYSNNYIDCSDIDYIITSYEARISGENYIEGTYVGNVGNDWYNDKSTTSTSGVPCTYQSRFKGLTNEWSTFYGTNIESLDNIEFTNLINDYDSYTKSILNTYSTDEAILENNWVSNLQSKGIIMINTEIHISQLIIDIKDGISNSSGTIITTLPLKYRPTIKIRERINDNNYITIDNNTGKIMIFGDGTLSTITKTILYISI